MWRRVDEKKRTHSVSVLAAFEVVWTYEGYAEGTSGLYAVSDGYGRWKGYTEKMCTDACTDLVYFSCN